VSREPPSLDVLAESFLTRVRAGEPLNAAEFAQSHPEAVGLQDVLEAMLLLEGHKQAKAGSDRGRPRLQLPKLERLGDYRIVREIGRGGMGVVFEAVQESLDRRVALKVLPSQLLTGTQLQRFQREAQTAAQLHHSNIVPVFGSGEHDGFHFYAMQFLDGRGLDRVIDELHGRQLDAAGWAAHCRAMAAAAAQVADALHYAHGRGTLHRDVKPSNLLLDQQGAAWVTDFGLAKALEAEGLTQSGDVLGTLQYMAPEQLRGIYDVRSEVYALGTTLFELLCLQPAFGGDNRHEMIDRIRQGRARDLRTLAPDVPSDLLTIVRTAMAVEPKDRYADASALAQDLRRWLAGEPVAARRHSAPELLWRWCGRNRALAALAASLLLAVVGIAVVGWSAYAVTETARGDAEASSVAAIEQGQRAASYLKMTLGALDAVFDAVVGTDPYHVVEVDSESGDYATVARSAVAPKDAAVLQALLGFYDRLSAEDAGNTALRAQSVKAWRRMGLLHVRLGDDDKAEQAFTNALEIANDLHGSEAPRHRAALHNELGNVALRQGRLPVAREHFRSALAELGNDVAAADAGRRFEAARAHYLLATVIPLRPPPTPAPGEPQRPQPVRDEIRQQAGQELEQAEALVRQLLHEDPANPEFLLLRARSLAAAERMQRGDNRRLDEAVAILEGLCLRFPDADVYHFELVETMLAAPGVRSPGGRGGADADEAMERLDTAVVHSQKLLGMAADNRAYQACAVQARSARGVALAQLGRGSEAATDLQAAVGAYGDPATTGDRDPRTLAAELAATVWLARFDQQRGDADAARRRLTAALTGLQRAIVQEHRARLPIEASVRTLWLELAAALDPTHVAEIRRRLLGERDR
jgi:tetratricopeptide (TPR) repeat protein